MDVLKDCRKCLSSKNVDEFGKNKDGKLGLHSNCLECQRISAKKYRRTKGGLLVGLYKGMKSASKKRNHPLPSFTKEDFILWVERDDNFDKLYSDWVVSDFNKNKKPSIDRKDNYKPYSFSNIQLTIWVLNSKSFDEDRKDGRYLYSNKPVLQYDLNKKLIKEHYSISSAGREIMVSTSQIIKVCKKKGKTAGGFIWEYKTV